MIDDSNVDFLSNIQINDNANNNDVTSDIITGSGVSISVPGSLDVEFVDVNGGVQLSELSIEPSNDNIQIEVQFLDAFGSVTETMVRICF
jgi:hypothetical protein